MNPEEPFPWQELLLLWELRVAAPGRTGMLEAEEEQTDMRTGWRVAG